MLRRLVWVSGVCMGFMVSGCGGDDDASETADSGGTDSGGTGGSAPNGSGGSTAGGGTGGSGTGNSGTGGSRTSGSDNTGGAGTGGSGTGGGGTGGGGTGGSGGGATGPKPRGADHAPTLGAQIDRMGRAAIGTALIATFSADADAKGRLKDDYNAAEPEAWSSFEDEMRANLAVLDSLDENCGNQLLADASDTRYATLAGILADDRLYVLSTVGECGVYLGLEGEIAGALEAGAGMCGGRTPDDDVIERSYSVLAAGLLSGVDDSITENDKENSDEFPFLASPH